MSAQFDSFFLNTHFVAFRVEKFWYLVNSKIKVFWIHNSIHILNTQNSETQKFRRILLIQLSKFFYTVCLKKLVLLKKGKYLFLLMQTWKKISVRTVYLDLQSPSKIFDFFEFKFEKKNHDVPRLNFF